MTIWIGWVSGTPLGPLAVAANLRGLLAVEYGMPSLDAFAREVTARFGEQLQQDAEHTRSFLSQIEEYLAGKRQSFELAIDWAALRPFQASVLQATFAIPYGETRSYGQIAAQIGNPRAARAVGRAQATNPMPLVIPCHRVLGADGSLHGYGGYGGLKTKAWLLKLEGAL